ncbi:MAG TPA: 30S ribosome-binding factor RbfA [Candidatus Binatia bacterium]
MRLRWNFFTADMDHQRSERVGDLLIEIISDLLRQEIRDPRVATVTLTEARVSKDLKHAQIYFNVLGGAASRSEVLAGLKSASGFIRGRVGRELKLRYVPTIEFVYDDSEDQAQRIDHLLNQIKS